MWYIMLMEKLEISRLMCFCTDQHAAQVRTASLLV